jgi:competence protein ComEC
MAMVAGALEREADDLRGKRRPGIADLLRTAAAAQQGRAFLWSPIAITFGIWFYFGLASEPSLVVAGAIAVAATLMLWFGRTIPLLFLAGLMASGLVLAKIRTEITATPLLSATTPEVRVTGRVIGVDRASRSRLTLLLDTEAIADQPPEHTPRRLRLSLAAKLGTPIVGTRVALNARLAPLPSPVQPGGFDYGRRLWFGSIGGTGRATSPIEVLDPSIPLNAQFSNMLSSVRAGMSARIAAVLEEPYASFAEALINGERSSIPQDMNQSLMVSGLFHILSISGLHMWLVVGGVFWTARAAMALIPPVALRFPIKKWAALVALAMGLFYMLLANSGVATQRSFIMIAVVFFAVLVDRPALSTRNLAIAAWIILLSEPEAAVEAGFQMSFLAVLGLVAFYEAWVRFTVSRDGEFPVQRHWLKRFGLKVTKAIAASILTTLVAGTMSSIPAAYHFGRLAPYSLIANGLALPVISILVMPFALIAAVLMPLGLERFPLYVMGEGLHLVMAISNWVAGFPGAHVVAPQPSPIAVAFLGAGACAICLLTGWARALGVMLVIPAVTLLFASAGQPDILIERTGQNVALRSADGLLVPALAKRARFTVEKWLIVNGEEIRPVDAARRSGWTCLHNRCDATVKGKRIAYLSKLEDTVLDCDGIDILITDFPLRRSCRSVPLRIDRFDLWRAGAHAICIENGAVVVETARGSQGDRPWVVRPEARKTPFKPFKASDGGAKITVH